MKVLTDNKYYSQIANVIREQNGTNNTYKPPQMVSALKDLFYEEVEGVPPISFNGIGENLLDYRIDGASGGVGDRTENLFDFGEWSKNINANRDNSLAKGIDGITITANSNDAFTIPYAYAYEGVYKIYVKPNTNYLLSWVSNNNLYGRVFIFKNGIPDNTHMVSTNNNTTKYLLFGTDADTEFITLRFGVETTGNTITYSKIMLNEGSTALPYEPYGYKVPVVVNGKNLLQNNATSQTKNGVTFTVNEDKSISCNGTASGNAFFKIGDIQLNKNCIMSGCSEGGDNNSYLMRLYNNGSVFKTDSGTGVLINSEVQNGYVEIRIAAGYTCNNLTFYPMIRPASIEDTSYEPYVETTTNIYLDKPIEAKANIPSEYEEVEYIESTGTQYIDTGFVPNSNSGFKTKIVFSGYSDGIDDFIIGLRSNSNYGRFAYTCTDFNNITFYCSFGTTTSSSYRYNSNMPTTEIIECELNYKNSNTTITQGVEGLLTDKNNFVGEGLSFYLAGAYNAKGIPKYKAMRQYKCELTQGTEVVRDFIPCYRKSDNEAGLYDLVNNTFYTNQGTGNFIVGPIKENESISLSDTNVNIQTIRGTNVLTVDTTVQPSNVYVKSRHESSHEAQIRQLYESVNAELTQYKAQYGELGGE